jgi:UDP-N-acetyl-D-mannosaminuronate dehydrogenase
VPHIHHEYDGWHMDSVKELAPALAAADAVIIVTDHKSYDYKSIIGASQFVFDTRNATARIGKDLANVVRL